MNSYFVSNWRLLIGSFLGFMGGIVIAIDKFPVIHHQISRVQKWSNIQHAVADLNVLDQPIGGIKVGYVAPSEPGFDDLVNIIRLNKPELNDKIVGIIQGTPMAVGGVPSKIIHVIMEGPAETVPVTTDFIFHEWVAKYRERFFLKLGLLFVTLGFLMGIIGRIDKRKKTPVKNMGSDRI